jgi:hypothetical protein
MSLMDFMVFFYIKIYLQDVNTHKDEMGRTCGAYGGGKRSAQGVGGET